MLHSATCASNDLSIKRDMQGGACRNIARRGKVREKSIADQIRAGEKQIKAGQDSRREGKSKDIKGQRHVWRG